MVKYLRLCCSEKLIQFASYLCYFVQITEYQNLKTCIIICYERYLQRIIHKTIPDEQTSNTHVLHSISVQDNKIRMEAWVCCEPCNPSPVIQANGRLSFEVAWGLEACFTVFHSEPASALSLLTVWSLQGNPAMARCWRKSDKNGQLTIVQISPDQHSFWPVPPEAWVKTRRALEPSLVKTSSSISLIKIRKNNCWHNWLSKRSCWSCRYARIPDMNVIRRLSSRVCSCVISVIIVPCMAIPVVKFQVLNSSTTGYKISKIFSYEIMKSNKNF